MGKSEFYQNKKIFNIDDTDVNKILFSRKEPSGKKMHLNTLLDIMIMMLLDHYVSGVHKWLVILQNLMKM